MTETDKQRDAVRQTVKPKAAGQWFDWKYWLINSMLINANFQVRHIDWGTDRDVGKWNLLKMCRTVNWIDQIWKIEIMKTFQDFLFFSVMVKHSLDYPLVLLQSTEETHAAMLQPSDTHRYTNILMNRIRQIVHSLFSSNWSYSY